MVEVKFCGMTRPADAAHAAAIGARYVGVVFAESPRRVDAEVARALFASLPREVARVGVFGAAPAPNIAATANELGLHVVQLHGDPDAKAIAEVRRRWDGLVWAVQRVEGSTVPPGIADLFEVADGVVLDARVAGALGGTGVALPWSALRDQLATFRARRARLILAGGLNPSNVSHAIDTLAPDVVDVSSGVEAGVGVKDHDRMRAFADAVYSVAPR